MTESTGFTADPAGTVYPPAATDAAAGQLAQAAAATTGAADAGAAVGQVAADPFREVLLPMEQRIEEMMRQFADQSAAQSREIAQLRAQLATAQASAGPPPVVDLSQAVSDRLHTAAATAGLPAEHWRGVLGKAADLAAAGKEAVQSGTAEAVAKVQGLAQQVEQWVNRVHPRTAGTVIEHFPALLDDLERLAEAAAALVP